LENHSIVLTRALREWPLPENPRGVEVGVLKGLVSFMLLREFPTLDLWGVDPYLVWPKDVYQTKCMGHWDQKQWDEVYETVLAKAAEEFGDRFKLLRTVSLAASQSFEDGFFDFVFIDGNHGYEWVSSDIAAWWPKVRGGGLFAGHDYGTQPTELGVKKAVDDFCVAEDLVLHTGDDAMWWVFKPATD
jgi:hypothetical protein